jgi:hypothetical protein
LLWKNEKGWTMPAILIYIVRRMIGIANDLYLQRRPG